MSADTDGESQDYEHDSQPFTWPNIKVDESKMKEIGNNKDNPPQIIEVAMAVLEISTGIDAIIIPRCLLLLVKLILFFSVGTEP